MSEFVNIEKKHWRRIKILIAMSLTAIAVSTTLNDTILLLEYENKANSNYYVVTTFTFFIIVLPYLYLGYMYYSNVTFERKYRNQNE